MRLLDGSGVSREAPAPFWEGLRVKFPRPTHQEPVAQHGHRERVLTSAMISRAAEGRLHRKPNS